MKNCPRCNKPLLSHVQDVDFNSQGTPHSTLTVRLQAQWCPTPNCFRQVKDWNSIDRPLSEFIDEVLKFRDKIYPIANGVMERKKNVSQYDISRGERPVKLKDAREICKGAIERLNVAINKAIESVTIRL